MRHLILSGLFLSLFGCAVHTPAPDLEPPVTAAPVNVPREPEATKPHQPVLDLFQLQTNLGLSRDVQDLGFAEKSFDGCRAGVRDKNGKCGPHYMTVVHFRLLCRDTEETVSEVTRNFSPLISDQVKWKVGELNGVSKTDSGGYGQVQILSAGSLRGQRLVLIAGKQFLGREITEDGPIVVPVYWCLQR